MHSRLVANLQQVLQTRESNVELIETHISSVLLAGDFAYKIKKPLDLGFLDFSTLARRRLLCQEEVRLNGRLAPDIYLDVVTITGSIADPAIGGAGEALEYAVRMRRFSQQGLLSSHPEALTPEVVDAIVSQLTGFHGTIARVPADQPYGSPGEVLQPMLQNFRQIDSLPGSRGQRSLLEELEDWTLKRFEALKPLIARRKSKGFVRECHGDLHLGNIALEDGRPILFDGIEFNPSLRWIDTMSELAFLLMDMEEKGRSPSAQRLLNGYMESSGDYQGLDLLRFYQVYRAMVRAKVSAIRRHQEEPGADEWKQLGKEFSAYLSKARDYTRKGSPVLLITHGLSGSGKSTLAAELVEALPALRLRSDVERKRLLGLAPETRTGSRPGGGIYTVDLTRKTYAQLLELAEGILRSGFSVVVDATFLKAGQRRPFQELARRQRVPFLILDLQVAVKELRARVVKRQAEGRDPSEAGLKVLEAQLTGVEQLTPAEQRMSLVLTPEQGMGLASIRKALTRISHRIDEPSLDL